MSSATPPDSHSPSISSDALADAAERRTRQLPLQQTAGQLAAEHDKKQKFRRLVDPGIFRPNSRDQALESLKTLLTISENLLREPHNPKFQQFKPTNQVIKRTIMDPKGTLEYAIGLGFRPEVKNFQPYYTFNPRFMDDLKIGAAILQHFVQLETEREERAALAKKSEKAVAEAAAEKVKLAFMDDRKTKMQRDEIEKERRAARAASLAQAALVGEAIPMSPSTSASLTMPGSGHTLDGPPPDDDLVQDENPTN